MDTFLPSDSEHVPNENASSPLGNYRCADLKILTQFCDKLWLWERLDDQLHRVPDSGQESGEKEQREDW